MLYSAPTFFEVCFVIYRFIEFSQSIYRLLFMTYNTIELTIPASEIFRVFMVYATDINPEYPLRITLS